MTKQEYIDLYTGLFTIQLEQSLCRHGISEKQIRDHFKSKLTEALNHISKDLISEDLQPFFDNVGFAGLKKDGVCVYDASGLGLYSHNIQ